MYAPLASREQLLAELERIDVEGWDSEPGRALLAHVRCHVVRRFIALSRFHGPLAADLEASAWSAVWESLANASDAGYGAGSTAAVTGCHGLAS